MLRTAQSSIYLFLRSTRGETSRAIERGKKTRKHVVYFHGVVPPLPAGHLPFPSFSVVFPSFLFLLLDPFPCLSLFLLAFARIYTAWSRESHFSLRGVLLAFFLLDMSQRSGNSCFLAHVTFPLLAHLRACPSLSFFFLMSRIFIFVARPHIRLGACLAWMQYSCSAAVCPRLAIAVCVPLFPSTFASLLSLFFSRCLCLSCLLFSPVRSPLCHLILSLRG